MFPSKLRVPVTFLRLGVETVVALRKVKEVAVVSDGKSMFNPS